MKQKFGFPCKVIFLSLPLLVVRADTFHWPMGADKEVVRGLTSTFGEDRTDHFHNGLDLAGQGKAVRAMATGTVLFSRMVDDHPFRPLEGPGNQLLLRHNDLISGYYHLKEIKRREGSVQAGENIALSGNTGYSGGAHLHFFLLDKNQFLNPLKYLPAAADPAPPTGARLHILTGSTRTTIQPEKLARIRLTRKYPVVLEIHDPGLEQSRRGIYQLSWKLNQDGEQARQFDHLSFSEGAWRLDGKGFSDVFQAGHYLLGELPFQSGENRIEIKARDFAGNVHDSTFLLDVQKEF